MKFQWSALARGKNVFADPFSIFFFELDFPSRLTFEFNWISIETVFQMKILRNVSKVSTFWALDDMEYFDSVESKCFRIHAHSMASYDFILCTRVMPFFSSLEINRIYTNGNRLFGLNEPKLDLKGSQIWSAAGDLWDFSLCATCYFVFLSLRQIIIIFMTFCFKSSLHLLYLWLHANFVITTSSTGLSVHPCDFRRGEKVAL